MNLRRNGHKKCMNKLGMYENTGLEPEEVGRINDFANSQLAIILSELQEYQRSELNGDIIRLPYRLDDRTILFNNDGGVHVLHCADKADADEHMETIKEVGD